MVNTKLKTKCCNYWHTRHPVYISVIAVGVYLDRSTGQKERFGSKLCITPFTTELLLSGLHNSDYWLVKKMLTSCSPLNSHYLHNIHSSVVKLWSGQDQTQTEVCLKFKSKSIFSLTYSRPAHLSSMGSTDSTLFHRKMNWTYFRILNGKIKRTKL